MNSSSASTDAHAPTRADTRPTQRIGVPWGEGPDVPERRATSRRGAEISRVPYLPGLDGMRALAVVAVMVYHANSDWLPGGYLGVEVFSTDEVATETGDTASATRWRAWATDLRTAIHARFWDADGGYPLGAPLRHLGPVLLARQVPSVFTAACTPCWLPH